MASLSDLDPFAIEPPVRRNAAPQARVPSPLEELAELADPLSMAAQEEARRVTEQRRLSVEAGPSSQRLPPRRMSSNSRSLPITGRRESIDASLYVPPSSPPATSVLSQFNTSRPAPRMSLESNDSFSDFQAASPGSPSGSPSFSSSLKSTWSQLKASSAHARPALANLFNDSPPGSRLSEKAQVSYFSGAPGYAGERAMSWDEPVRTASPIESAKPPPITLRGVRQGLIGSLTEDLAESIRPSLQPRTRLAAVWQLVYSLDQHGTSLTTLYKRAATTDSPCVLVIKDAEGHIFGAFLNEPLRRSEAYYGTGECFLWKSLPFGPDDIRIGIGVKAFKWTGRNTYCIFSNDQYINVGGGDGKFGLWVDAALSKGFSARCSTFDNDCLCTTAHEKEAQCDIIALELWRIG